MRRLDHRPHVLVGAGGFLGDAAIGWTADEDTAAGEMLDHVVAAPLFERLMTAHTPAGAMAGGTEGQLFALHRTDQNVRRRAHSATDQHRLADGPQRHRQVRVARSKGARRPFAVHEEPLGHTVDAVLFDFAGVVGHIVQQG